MSIRIIKPGKLKNITYRFTCPKCECIFETEGFAAVAEQPFDANDSLRRLAKCPCCGRFVTGVEVSGSGRV